MTPNMPRHLAARFSTLLALVLVLVTGLILTSCDGSETLHLAGTVERRTLELATPVSEVITALPVEEGQRVAAEQIVVQLDTEVAEAELRASEASLAAARAWLVEAEGKFTRQSDLKKRNVATAQELDAARRERDEALAQVAERQARIAQAQKHLDDLTLRSRESGVVDQLPFELGERVPAGGVAAVVLSDERPWVRVWMPARAVSRLQIGSSVTIEIEGLDEALSGTVRYLAHESEFTPHFALTERESAHLVYETRVVIDDAPPGLRPGLPARIRLRLDEPGK